MKTRLRSDRGGGGAMSVRGCLVESVFQAQTALIFGASVIAVILIAGLVGFLLGAATRRDKSMVSLPARDLRLLLQASSEPAPSYNINMILQFINVLLQIVGAAQSWDLHQYRQEVLNWIATMRARYGGNPELDQLEYEVRNATAKDAVTQAVRNFARRIGA